MTISDTTVAFHSSIIGGDEERSSAETIDRLSPYDGRLVARVARGTRADALRAIAVARDEFDRGTWPRTAGVERSRVLLRWAQSIGEAAEELAQLESVEVGKPISTARAELGEAIALIERAANTASNLHGELHDDLGGGLLGLVRREPVGVVGAIVPWNLPAYLFIQKVAFALAAGCTVVAKPSEFTSGSAVLLTRLAHDAGVPVGALNLITGAGAEVGQPLAESTDVDVLSFTGSTKTANTLSRVERPFPQRQHFELGGKGTTIVFADADLDQAVDGALFGFTVNQGESCTATTRLLVQDSVADAFIHRLQRLARSLRLGDPAEESTVIGPMITPDHKARVQAYVEHARGEGAEVFAADIPEGVIPDSFIAPTIVDRITTASAIFQEEVFGPVLAIRRFRDFDEAIELANSTQYGLADGVWTSDISTGIKAARAIKTGTVWINTVHEHPTGLPFGGTKASGFGREKASVGVEEFTQLKTITVQIGERTRMFPDAPVVAP
jgi:acyl-CoA reductase-like NAD-dependent aldehyde dehydrogenase